MNPKRIIETLQLITHPVEGNSPFDQAKQALEGSCRWIQLRMKNHDAESILSEGRKIMDLKQFYDFKFIINDNPAIALELNADGVHLGKQDMQPREARKLLGEKYIVGGTANSREDIAFLANEEVDYIGLGPFRFTATKEKLSPVLGAEGYRQLMIWMTQNGIHIPVVGIGGVLLGDVDSLLETGLHGIAVSSAITQADSITSATKSFLKKLQKN